MSFILVRYGDLINPANNMFKNYKFPRDHYIIKSIKKNAGGSFFGYYCDDTDNSLTNFFINNKGAEAYEITPDLLIACRDPDIQEVLELYYYS